TPLAAELGDRPLVVVPAGVLHTAPWAALPCLEGRAVTVAASAQSWLAAAHDIAPLPRRRGPLLHHLPHPAPASGPSAPPTGPPLLPRRRHLPRDPPVPPRPRRLPQGPTFLPRPRHLPRDPPFPPRPRYLPQGLLLYEGTARKPGRSGHRWRSPR